MSDVDPTSIYCPVCEAVPGEACRTISDTDRAPHSYRRRMAAAVDLPANRPDPELLEENRPEIDLGPENRSW